MFNSLVILSSRQSQEEVKFSEKSLQDAYEGFFNLVRNGQKKELRIANIEDYDFENKIFKKGIVFDNEGWSVREEDFKPLGIIDKMQSSSEKKYYQSKLKIAKEYPYINVPDFSLIFASKLTQVLSFGAMSPTSFLVSSKEEASFFVDKIKSEKVVVKPLIGYGGKGIEILEKQDFNLDNFSSPILIQEFVDTDAKAIGMEGEVADLRVVLVGENISYACTRIAKKGSLMTNFHQGAMMEILDESVIPDSAMEVISRAKKILAPFRKKYYSLDFIFDKKSHPWLMEMNTRPGIDLFSSDDFEVRDRFLEETIDLLLK